MNITWYIIIAVIVLFLGSLLVNKNIRNKIINRAKLIGKSQGTDEVRIIEIKKAEKQIVKNQSQINENQKQINKNNELIKKAQEVIKQNEEVISNAKKTIN